MNPTATLTRKTAKTQADCFHADHAKFNEQLEAWGAVRTLTDNAGETFQVIDPTKAPADFIAMYGRFLTLGYANGYI
jgi:hypothetical protein